MGLEPVLLRHRFHCDVCTLDIDADFGPDYVGSVHSMKMFSDQQFDVVIASHVLEHLPFSYFRDCLAELARVAPRHRLSALRRQASGMEDHSFPTFPILAPTSIAAVETRGRRAP